MCADILILEDEWLIAEDLASALRAAHHRVIGPWASVKSAFLCIDETPLDLAILDIELNGETSFAVAERLQAESLPFLFLSGHGAKVLPPSLRGHSVLSKPVEKKALLELIKRMCPLG